MNELSTRSPGKRRYDASGRRARAQRTRAEIVEVALREFVADGYAATTMAAIAAAAGVSVETIYGAFGSKAALLAAALTAAVRGHPDAAPLERQEVVLAIQAEPDPRRKLERYADLLAVANPRIAPVVRVLREAAAAAPEAAEVYERYKADRLQGMSRFAAHLHAEGALRPGVSRAQARDVLWTLNSADLHDLLVTDRGWSAKRYAAWVGAQMAAALLP